MISVLCMLPYTKITTLPLIIINITPMFLFVLATSTIKEKYIVGQAFIYVCN